MIERWSRIIVLTAIFALTWGPRAAAASEGGCSRIDAMKALDEADRLKDWNAVYRSFKRFAACDDGAIAEGYSDTVGRLLDTDWAHLDLLYRLTVADASFKRFVLRHIDPTIPANTLKRIRANATTRCPKKANPICESIDNRAATVTRVNAR